MAEEDTPAKEYGYDSLLSEYNEVVSGEDKTVDSLYKMAELAYFMSNETDEDERKKWLVKGREHAPDALKLNPESLNVVCILGDITATVMECAVAKGFAIDTVNLIFEFMAASGEEDGTLITLEYKNEAKKLLAELSRK